MSLDEIVEVGILLADAAVYGTLCEGGGGALTARDINHLPSLANPDKVHQLFQFLL